MILFDCGNTALKWQCWEADSLSCSGGLHYGSNWLESLGRLLVPLQAHSVYLTSVLNTERQQALEALLSEKQMTWQRLQSSASDLGVSSAYDEPQTLGDDRWMTLLAAHALVTEDCMVIDAGSAITLDLLRADGQHLGGAIIPGTRTSRDHFREIFSYLDLSELQADASRPPGCSTPAAIHIDYNRDSIEILIQLMHRWQSLLDGNHQVLLAGGDADRVEARLPTAVRRVPDLVFTGMRCLIKSRGLQVQQ